MPAYLGVSEQHGKGPGEGPRKQCEKVYREVDFSGDNRHVIAKYRYYLT